MTAKSKTKRISPTPVTTLDGSKLKTIRPNKENQEIRPHEVSYMYWVGCTAEFRNPGITIAGISFPKLTETIRVNPKVKGPKGKERVKQLGSLVQLTHQDLEKLAERLQWTVVRTHVHTIGEKDGGMGKDTENTGDKITRATSLVIPIPTPEDIQAAKNKERFVKPFLRTDDDRDVAEFLYMVPCNSINPRPRSIDHELPQTLAEMGEIPLPDERFRMDSQNRVVFTGDGPAPKPEPTADAILERFLR